MDIMNIASDLSLLKESTESTIKEDLSKISVETLEDIVDVLDIWAENVEDDPDYADYVKQLKELRGRFAKLLDSEVNINKADIDQVMGILAQWIENQEDMKDDFYVKDTELKKKHIEKLKKLRDSDLIKESKESIIKESNVDGLIQTAKSNGGNLAMIIKKLESMNDEQLVQATTKLDINNSDDSDDANFEDNMEYLQEVGKKTYIWNTATEILETVMEEYIEFSDEDYADEVNELLGVKLILESKNSEVLKLLGESKGDYAKFIKEISGSGYSRGKEEIELMKKMGEVFRPKNFEANELTAYSDFETPIGNIHVVFANTTGEGYVEMGDIEEKIMLKPELATELGKWVEGFYTILRKYDR